MNKLEFEEEGDTYSVRVPILTDLEKEKIDNNIDDIVKEFTKEVLYEKDMIIVQHIMRRQQEKIEQLEAEKQEVIDYLKEEISTMGSGKGMFLVKTALGAVLEKIEKGE